MKIIYAKKCAALDREIDALVYELYGLTAAKKLVAAHCIQPA